MSVRLLGPVDVVSDADGTIALGRKERVVLAVLAVAAGEFVPEGRLADALWGDDPPPTATKTLRSYISRLRRALGASGAVITADASGYRLDAGQVDLDTAAVEELLAMASAARGAGRHAIAAALYRDALAVWRGPSLGELAAEPWAVAEAARLDELRVSALEARVDADLACGQHLALVGELEALTSTYPYRERLWAARMVALYRSGRQADALRVFADLRSLLAEELGLDPSAELRELETRILQQDPVLTLDQAERDTPDRAPAPALPSGVVTFLLTDVVGSTRLWEELPLAMADAMARHDHHIATAVEAAGGMLLKSRGEGDSTFSVFGRASGAAQAALDAQAAFASADWPEGIDLQVRAAIHVGQAIERDGDYYGPAVNRAARLKAIAGGGEVLLSGPVAEMLLDDPSTPWAIETLGERALKDLARPEQVYRLLATPSTTERVAVAGAPVLTARLSLPAPLAHRGGDVVRPGELAVLEEAWAAVVAGERKALLLSGEPGIGKTWLASALAHRAADGGAAVLFGRCDDEIGSAYQPFNEALRPLLHALGPGVADLAGAGELRRIVPALDDVVSQLPLASSGDADAERWLLFEAVANVLERVSESVPLLADLDDLHWAGRDGLLLLRHLLRSMRPMRLLVVGTYRHTELDRTHPLATMLADLRADGTVARVALDGLDEGAIGVLVRTGVAGIDASEADDLARALRRETSGNPFFVVESLRHLVETGAFVKDGGGPSLADVAISDRGLPESVREVLAQRLNRLSPAANRVLTIAAVLGPTFTARLLEAVPDATGDGTDVIDSLDEAVRAGLLHEEEGRIAFSHALVRHALLDELSATRRMRLHRQIGEAIETLPEAAHHTELLAHHFIECALDGGAVRAATYAARAAHAALRASSYEHAADLARRGIEALDACNINDPARRGALGVWLIRAAFALRGASRSELRTMSEAMLEDALRGDDAVVLADAIETRWLVGTRTESDEPLRRAVDVALRRREELDEEKRAIVLSVAAMIVPSSLDEAGELLDEAQALAAAGSHARFRVLRARAHWLFGQPAASELIAIADELDTIYERTGDFSIILSRGSSRVLACAATCDLDGIRAELDRRAEVSRRTQGWHAVYMERIIRGLLAQLDGAWDAVERLGAELLAHGPDDPDAVNVWAALEFQRHRETGRAAEFLPAVEAVASENPSFAQFLAARALAYADVGNTDAARDAIDGLMETLDEVRHDQLWPIHLAVVAEATAIVGDAAAARRLVELLEPWSGALIATASASFHVGLADQILAGLHLATGDADAARRHAARAVDQAARLSSPPLRARALYWRGRAEAAAGEVDRARASFEDAIAIAGAHGAHGIATVAATAIAQLERIS